MARYVGAFVNQDDTVQGPAGSPGADWVFAAGAALSLPDMHEMVYIDARRYNGSAARCRLSATIPIRHGWRTFVYCM